MITRIPTDIPGRRPPGDRATVVAQLELNGQDGDPGLDAVLRVLTTACRVPVAVVSILTPGRQVFAAEIGVGTAAIDIEERLSFCASVVATAAPLVVEDALTHPVFRDVPQVCQGAVRAYAGQPLFHRGLVVGTLAVFDQVDRRFTAEENRVLDDLARTVELLLDARYDAHHVNAGMLRALVDHAPCPMYVKDLDGRFVLANHSLESAFGVVEADLLGRTAAVVDPDLAGGWDSADHRARAGSYTVDEHSNLSDGRHVYESTKFPITDPAGRVYAIGGVSFDVTARRQAVTDAHAARDAAVKTAALRIALEEQLHQQRRLEGLGQLAGGIAHDFNNLLAVITAHADFISDTVTAEADRTGSDRWEQAATDVASIQSAVDRAADLTHRLLTVTRREVVQPRLLDLNQAITAADAQLRCGLRPGVRLVLDLDPAVGPVMADPVHLRQVFANLVANATDAMPGGGTVTMTTTTVPDGAAVPGATPAPRVRLQVSDTGRGIAADHLGRVFEPFFTTKTLGGGAGLGLATVHAITDQIGAAIDVQSTVDVGTAVTVTFATAERAPQLEGETRPHCTARTVLLVDDGADLRQVTGRLLEQAGYTVLAAADGAEAVDLAATVPAGRLDLLLTDLVMPEMTGDQVAARVRLQHPDAAVLFMSGYAAPVLTATGLPGDCALLKKPFTRTGLLTAIDGVLRDPAAKVRAEVDVARVPLVDLDATGGPPTP